MLEYSSISYSGKQTISKKLFEKHSTSFSLETTPRAISNYITEVSLNIGSNALFLPVIKDSHGLYGFCEDGVRSKIAEIGGSIVFGWIIWEWPRVWLHQEFHAVWKCIDTDSLKDITPKPNGETSICFVPDPKFEASYSMDDHRPRRDRVFIYDPQTHGIPRNMSLSKYLDVSKKALRYSNEMDQLKDIKTKLGKTYMTQEMIEKDHLATKYRAEVMSAEFASDGDLPDVNSR